MKVIVCLDDRDGMLFCGKRQSRDRKVCERIMQLAEGSRLWMNDYSTKLFADYPENILVDTSFLDRALDEDFCFVEDCDITPYVSAINQIVIFRWNRHYPGDKCFPVDITVLPWKLVKTCDFQGYSHEKITMEVYRR